HGEESLILPLPFPGQRATGPVLPVLDWSDQNEREQAVYSATCDRMNFSISESTKKPASLRRSWISPRRLGIQLFRFAWSNSPSKPPILSFASRAATRPFLSSIR